MSTRVITTICPNIDTNLEHHDIKLVSPSAVTWRQWISTSYSNVSTTWSMPSPNTSIYIDRMILCATPITITYAGTSTGSLLENGKDALRAFPIASITTSNQLTLNNATFTFQTSELVPKMARFWDTDSYDNHGFPSMLDTYQRYQDGDATNANPLANYGNMVGKVQPRGAYPMVIVNGVSSTAASISATIYEPIWIPCLHRKYDDGLGFTNVRSFDLVSNYSSNLSRIVSHSLGSSATITSVTVNVTGNPIIFMKYNTPPYGYVPRTISYRSEDINRFITPCPTAPLTANSSVTFPSTNIQLNCIPKWVIICCIESALNSTYTTTDTALNISNISINFNNQSGLCSSMSEFGLWKTSAENGLQDSWAQYHGITQNTVLPGTAVGSSGSYIKLFFGKDIPLGTVGDYPGKVGAYNFSCNVTVTNVNQSASITSPQLYIITSSALKVVLHEGGACEQVLGIDDVEGSYMPFNQVSEYYGGSFKDFISKVWNGIKSVGRFIKDNKLISSIASVIPHPIAQTVGQVARSVGLGDEIYDPSEGGRIATRRELMRRVRAMKK